MAVLCGRSVLTSLLHDSTACRAVTLLKAPVQAVQVMPRDYHLSRTWVECFLWLSLALAFAGWGIETGGLSALQEVGCAACSTKALTLFASSIMAQGLPKAGGMQAGSCTSTLVGEYSRALSCCFFLSTACAANPRQTVLANMHQQAACLQNAKYGAPSVQSEQISASCNLQEAISLSAGTAYRLRPKRVCTITLMTRRNHYCQSNSCSPTEAALQ